MASPRKNPAQPLRVLDDIRSHRFRRVITEEWLRARWFSDMSLPEIARDAECSVTTITRYARRYRLPSRPRQPSMQGWDEVLAPEYLHATYLEGQMSCEAIAAEVGTTAGTVLRWLENYGIPRRG